MEPQFPQVHVQLMGLEGNAVLILGKVAKALRDAGVPRGEVMRFQQEAMRGDYDHLLRTVSEWVTVD